MNSIQEMSGVRVDGRFASSLGAGHPVMPVVASAHRAGWALAAINPQYKRRTAAATSTSVTRGTT